MTQTIITIVTINPHTCPTCGVLYGLPHTFERDRLDDGRNWHCPNGHFVVYSNNHKKRLDDATARLQAEQRRVTQLATENMKLDKKHRTLKARIERGICPKCTRTFSNIARHIAAKHPAKKKAKR